MTYKVPVFSCDFWERVSLCSSRYSRCRLVVAAYCLLILTTPKPCFRKHFDKRSMVGRFKWPKNWKAPIGLWHRGDINYFDFSSLNGVVRCQSHCASQLASCYYNEMTEIVSLSREKVYSRNKPLDWEAHLWFLDPVAVAWHSRVCHNENVWQIALILSRKQERKEKAMVPRPFRGCP
jgi:hypothetical protein